MRILDENGKEIISPDMQAGRLKADKILVKHHETVEPTEAVTHLEVSKRYPNGSADYRRVIDSPAQEAQAAWDEYEEIQRYIPYTQEQLDQIAAEKAAAEREARRLPNLEKENKLLREQVRALSGQNGFLEDCIAEMAAIVYA